jgi:methionine synthase I (cobalamin-dependent)
VEAGSQIILSNTFGANRIRLAEAELANRAVDINRAGVELSRRAAGERALVFASMGPTGKLIMNGDITAGEVAAAFAEQAEALAAAGANGLVVETMMDLEETTLAVTAARKTGLPVVACMVFDSGKNQDQTMMGSTIEDAVKALTAAGADVIGANCGQGISGFPAMCRRLRAATDRPIWLKPNAGLPQIVAGAAEYDATPAAFSALVPELIAAGANFIGGCCGTGPAFIKAIGRCLSERSELRQHAAADLNQRICPDAKLRAD